MKKLFLLLLVFVASLLPSRAQVLWVPGGALGNNTTNSYVGIGISSPAYSLHTSGGIGIGGNEQFTARYNNSEDYKGTFGWSHLQLGNNGSNWIVAGRTATGGALTFIVNNTADYAYASFNGIAAMHLASNGNVGIGTTSPSHLLEVTGGMKATQAGFGRGVYSNWPLVTQGFAAAFIEGTGQHAITILPSYSGYNYVVSDYFSGTTHLPLALSGRGPNPDLVLNTDGNVGIGTTNPTQKLSVNGTIRAKEVIVDTGWSDYVFADDYRLAPLSEIETHIKTERHLPGIPSAQEVADHGVSMGEMQSKLLAKIEELTLHAIAQEKALLAQQQEFSTRLQRLEQENATLRRIR